MTQQILPTFEDLPIGTFVVFRVHGKYEFQRITTDGLLCGAVGVPTTDEGVYRCVMTTSGAAVRGMASVLLIQSIKDELTAHRVRLTQALNPSAWGPPPWDDNTE